MNNSQSLNDDLELLSITIGRFITAHQKWCERHCPKYNGQLGYETTQFNLTINGIQLTLNDLERIQEIEESLLEIDPTATEFAKQGAWIVIQDDKFGVDARNDIQQQIGAFWAEAAAQKSQ